MRVNPRGARLGFVLTNRDGKFNSVPKDSSSVPKETARDPGNRRVCISSAAMSSTENFHRKFTGIRGGDLLVREVRCFPQGEGRGAVDRPDLDERKAISICRGLEDVSVDGSRTRSGRGLMSEARNGNISTSVGG